MSPACPRHEALVERALSDDATTADVERYADEVPTCPECRRVLAVALEVHPAVLDQAGHAGWDSIAADLPPTAGELALLREVDAEPRRSWRVWAAPAMLIAATGLLAVGAFREPVGAPPLAEPVVAPAAPQAQLRATPAPRTPSAPIPSQAAAAPAAPVAAPPTPPPAPTAASEPAPVTASWPAPTFVDLVGDRPKSAAPTTRDLRLELEGTPAAGDSVYLAIATTTEERLAVCVHGPEHGVVWRGDIPPGRIDLSVDGRRQAFRFGIAGVYTFAVSTTDYVECTDPVHVVGVEVR